MTKCKYCRANELPGNPYFLRHLRTYDCTPAGAREIPDNIKTETLSSPDVSAQADGGVRR